MTKETKARVLVVDDESGARGALEKLLSQDGYAVDTAGDGAAALTLFAETPFDVVVTDLNMPNMDGVELLKKLRAQDADLPVDCCARRSNDVSAAVAAMRAGADDYLTKPIDFERQLTLSIERALERRELRVETENLRRQLRDRDGDGLQGLVGASPAMQKVYRTARQVAACARDGARSPARAAPAKASSRARFMPLARARRNRSCRSTAPRSPRRCSRASSSVTKKARSPAPTSVASAASSKPTAARSFLDEIGEMPMSTQIKLLRVLQERTFERVGGNESVQVDVRLIAATNRDLAADVRDGRFREDLYYRLNVVQIEMPPLRMRGGDILVLANHFLRKFAEENHTRIEGFTDAARTKLLAHRWPGNVRALENAIERAVVLCEGNMIDDSDLPFEAATDALGPLRIPGATMAEIERHAILTTLDAVGGSTAKAAEILDISVRTIQYRLSEYGTTKA